MGRFGQLDGALISVGGPPPGTAMETTEDQWRSAFESVFLGALRTARAVATALGDGGSICLVLSSSVRSPIPGLAISNGLRPGLAMVAKTLADELGPRGVRVNGLLPGRIATDRLRELDSLGSGDPEAARARNSAAHPAAPLRRAGGVRPGRGVPAQPRGVLHHRGHDARRRRGAALAVSAGSAGGQQGGLGEDRRSPGPRARRGSRRRGSRCRRRRARPPSRRGRRRGRRPPAPGRRAHARRAGCAGCGPSPRHHGLSNGQVTLGAVGAQRAGRGGERDARRRRRRRRGRAATPPAGRSPPGRGRCAGPARYTWRPASASEPPGDPQATRDGNEMPHRPDSFRYA